ncbi:hypothetical protein Hanom_Chr02g00123731 [Helianthus anomalus]
MGDSGSSWMEGEVLPIIPPSCLWAGGGRVAHLEEPRGWRRSSSRPWPERSISRWLTHCFLSFKIKLKNDIRPRIKLTTTF